MKHGKKYTDAKKLIDATKLYDPEEAVSLPVRFVAEAIRVSPSDPSLERHGVHFEKVLSMLLPG